MPSSAPVIAFESALVLSDAVIDALAEMLLSIPDDDSQTLAVGNSDGKNPSPADARIKANPGETTTVRSGKKSTGLNKAGA